MLLNLKEKCAVTYKSCSFIIIIFLFLFAIKQGYSEASWNHHKPFLNPSLDIFFCTHTFLIFVHWCHLAPKLMFLVGKVGYSSNADQFFWVCSFGQAQERHGSAEDRIQRLEGNLDEKNAELLRLNQRLKINEEHNTRLSATVDKLLSGNIACAESSFAFNSNFRFIIDLIFGYRIKWQIASASKRANACLGGKKCTATRAW